MASYAIGDIQGCFAELQALLERIEFVPGRDTLWLAGDLVNRGPDSLEVLRWAHANRAKLRIVLGNHDLHLLARAAGIRSARKRDTLDAVLAASDRGELLDWLRTQPLIQVEGGRVMVHAGLLPGWSVEQAVAIAADCSAGLAGAQSADLLAAYEAETGRAWTADLPELDRRVIALTALTRMRTLDRHGVPVLDCYDAPAHSPHAPRPWYQQRPAAWSGYQLLFGHWAMLGFFQGDGVTCLDSGCVWGGTLTALRLEDGSVFQQPGQS